MLPSAVEKIQSILRDKIPAHSVVAEHTEVGHFYRHVPTNQLFASVTGKCGILDAPHLKKWAARLAVDLILKKVGEMDHYATIVELEGMRSQAILAHQDEFEQAGDIGNLGHAIVERYLLEWMETGVRPRDITVFITESDARCFAIARSAELFCRDFNAIPVASEMFVMSLKHKFAGTLDSLMLVLAIKERGSNSCNQHTDLITGELGTHFFLSMSTSHPLRVQCTLCGLTGEYEFALVDWKSSNQIDKVEYAMQVAAYWQALAEMTGLRPKRLYIVRLDKNQAKYEVRVLTNRPKAFKAFTHCSKVYDWLNDDTDKLVLANPKKFIGLNSLSFTEV